MARDLKAKCRKCRRANEKLFLKGERCLSPKCGMVKKAYAPGVHGKKMTRGLSEYGRQLAMKQKIKRIYGILEKQFRKHFDDVKHKSGIAGDLLVTRLEMRLDNIVYRAGFANSRSEARQLVNHGMFTVDGKRMDIPSFEVNAGMAVAVKGNKKENGYFKNQVKILKEKKDIPSWIHMDASKLEAKVTALPAKGDLDSNIDAQLIVEYYSR
ncbi:MAG: 30S ribosomal protein S4 [Candidatus Moranbacteria bacterium]|nr:30S ribosomal protein S4 [Candidatus Moranbacteria bacterium]